jgi:hypothetical protein
VIIKCVRYFRTVIGFNISVCAAILDMGVGAGAYTDRNTVTGQHFVAHLRFIY